MTDRNSDELIDKKIEAMLETRYISEFSEYEFIYVCTWDEREKWFEGQKLGDRVGMLCCIVGNTLDYDCISERLHSIAKEFNLDAPERIHWDETDQIGWLQYTNNPDAENERAIVKWLNKQIADHNAKCNLP